MAPLRHPGAKLLVIESPADGEPSMSEVTTIGLDLAKYVLTGGKTRLGGISKRGNQYLRRLLINGASANLLRSKATNAPTRRPASLGR
jgi:hypothetical protein